MARFASREVTEVASGGEQLAVARRKLGLSVAQVSHRLKLPTRHLEAMEASRWYELPPGDYGRYFVRAYASLVGVDPVPILERYTEAGEEVSPRPRLRPVIEQKHLDRPLTHPLRRLLVGLAIVGLVGYLSFAAWRTFSPPSLNLLSPPSDLVTQSSTVIVSGYTEAGTRVTINAEPIQVSEAGYFNTPLALTSGLNTITVVAQKSYGRAVTLRRQVLFTPPALPPGLGTTPMVP